MPGESSLPGDPWNMCNPAKRAACDRCRGQKLRCLRENQSEGSISSKCIRCNTAGAVCSFSLSKRAGRPPVPTNSAERRARARSGQSSQASTRSGQPEFFTRDHVPKSPLDENCDLIPFARNTTDDGKKRDAGHTSPTDDLVARSTKACMLGSAWEHLGNLPWPENLYDGGNSKTLGSFSQDYDWSLPDTLSTGQLNDIQANNLINNTLPAQLDDQMFMSSSLQNGLRGIDSQSGIPKSESEHESINVDTMSCVLGSNDLAEIGDEAPPEPSKSTNGIQHRRMHMLSELALDLFSQLTANEEYHRTQISTGSLGLREQLVGNMLKASADFLTLLKSFYPTSSPPAPLTSSTKTKVSLFDTTSDREISPSNTSIYSDFGSDFAPNTTSNHPPPHQWKHQQQRQASTSATTTTNSQSDTNEPVTADMSTIFQLLTCYIRLVHLHSIFYSQVHTYLTASPPSSPPPPPPLFPGMAVGGVPLDSFRNFQVKLLLQISTHVLGEIEMMLGLPEGYRISKRRDADDEEWKGILETSVSVQFVEMTMRENGRTGWGIERERVKGIRGLLGKLSALLRGTINI